MFKYTIKRLFQSLITVFLVVSCVFLLLRLLPTDYFFTEEQLIKLTDEQQHDMLQKYGYLDHPFVQLGRYYKNMIKISHKDHYFDRVALYDDGVFEITFLEDDALKDLKAEDFKLIKPAVGETPETEVKVLEAGYSTKPNSVYLVTDQPIEVQTDYIIFHKEHEGKIFLSKEILREGNPSSVEAVNLHYDKARLREDGYMEIVLKRAVSAETLKAEDITFEPARGVTEEDPLLKAVDVVFDENNANTIYVKADNEFKDNGKYIIAIGENTGVFSVRAERMIVNGEYLSIDCTENFFGKVKLFDNNDIMITMARGVTATEVDLSEISIQLKADANSDSAEGEQTEDATIKAVKLSFNEEMTEIYITPDGEFISLRNYVIRYGEHGGDFMLKTDVRRDKITGEKTSDRMDYLKNISVTLNFGDSHRIQSGDSVVSIIAPKIKISMSVGLAALAIALVVGVPLGIMQARYKDGILDGMGQGFTIFINAVPHLVTYFLVMIVGNRLFGLPLQYTTTDSRSAILPMVALSMGSIASYMLWMRRYMVDELNKDYIRLATLKGMSKTQVMFKHVMKNAFLPLAQYLPYSVLLTVGGSILVEKMFGVPGLGNLLPDAIAKYDTNLVQAIVSLYASLGILGLFFGDVLMIILDPRIRLTGKGGTR